MTWPGGKDGPGVWQRLVSLFPPHQLFIVPCLGDCAVLRHKRPARWQVAADSDVRAVDRFVGRWLDPLPLDLVVGDGVALVRQLFRVGWRAACVGGSGGGIPGVSYGGQLVAFSDVAVFVDPPYPMATRSGRRLYFEEWSDGEHVAALAVWRAVAELGAAVVVCSYPNDIYERELSAWRRFSHNVSTRRGVREEWVFCSFEEPARLHDARFYGGCRREREVLSRRIRRLTARMARAGERERGAVLQAFAARGWVLDESGSGPGD